MRERRSLVVDMLQDNIGGHLVAGSVAGREHRLDERQNSHADGEYHHEADHRRDQSGNHVTNGHQEHDGYDDRSVNTSTEPEILQRRRGRLVFPARRPAALVVPFALLTEVAGVIMIVTEGSTIGWVVCAAPVVTLLVTAVQRPTLELTREGVVQRQYPFSSLTKWESIDHFGITRAGNRRILAYRLVEGVPPPRRQPAAAMLRATDQPYDGGYFSDSIAAPEDKLLATVDAYLRSPERRGELPSSAAPATPA